MPDVEPDSADIPRDPNDPGHVPPGEPLRPPKPLARKITYLPDVHRLLPQNPDAEQGVLSSFLLAPLEVGGFCVERAIRPSHFHIPAHATVFGALLRLWEDDKPIDFIHLASYLRDRGKLEEVGGAAFVSSLFTFLPTAANALYYLEIVEEKHVLREIIRVGTEYAARSYDEQDEVPALAENFEKETLSILADRYRGNDVSTQELVMQAIGDIQLMYEAQGKVTGLETGYAGYDLITNGLQDGEMTIIAARPSCGKTAFALNIAEHIAVTLGFPVFFFSAEMSARMLMARLFYARARVNPQRIREGFVAERDFPAITAAAAQISKAPLKIDDTSAPTVSYIRARVRRWLLEQRKNWKAAGRKPEDFRAAVFVDYLTLLTPEQTKRSYNREQEVAQISGGLKKLAKDEHVPVVVLAQITRDVEKHQRRPRLSDLRESGSIEQDADVVAFLDRLDMRCNQDDPEEMERYRGMVDCIIAKQRNGEANYPVPLTFLKEFTRFEDRAVGVEPDSQGSLL